MTSRYAVGAVILGLLTACAESATPPAACPAQSVCPSCKAGRESTVASVAVPTVPLELPAELESGLAKAPPEESVAFFLGLQYTLAALGFLEGPFSGVWDAQTGAAVAAFRKHAELPANPELDKKTLDALFGAGRRIQERVAPLGTQIEYSDDGKILAAKGAWVSAEGGDAAAEAWSNLSIVRCVIRSGFCHATYASSRELMTLEEETLKITRVDAKVIEASTPEGRCAQWSLHIDRKEQKLRRTRTTLSAEGSCENMRLGKWTLDLVAPSVVANHLAEHTRREIVLWMNLAPRVVETLPKFE